MSTKIKLLILCMLLVYSSSFAGQGFTCFGYNKLSRAEKIKATRYEKQNKSQKFEYGHYRLFIDDPFGNTIEITDGQINT